MKNHLAVKRSGRAGGRAFLATLAAILLAATPPAGAQDALATWWQGKYASGDWFGVRPELEERGIIFTGSWRGNFYGIVDGGKSQRGLFDEEVHLQLKLDLEKMAGLTGLSVYGAARWRDGENPNIYAGASNAFNPSNLQVGKQWRMMPLYAMWESRDLFPVKDMVTLVGGWTNPYFFFIQQPDSRLFVNNAIHQTKGLVNNAIPWSGSYNTWGGHLKIKPVDWYYVQGGLYVAIPDALSTSNHGLYFAGAQPPDRNGLYAIGETGVTPKIAGLPGKYAFGGLYFGVENKSFSGEPQDGRYAFYWQADQMLFREPAFAEAPLMGKDQPGGRSAASGKEFKPVTAPAPAPKPSDQGLYFFSFFSYAPEDNNAMPFYFHTGLVYKGLIPTRDADQLGVVFGYGNYSSDKIASENKKGVSTHQTYEAVLEFDYRVQLAKFAYVQPFLQYLIRPNGTGLVENATILGLQMGVTF